MENYSGIVQQSLGGFVSVVVPMAREEEGKAQLTRKAAWAIHQLNTNIGLLKKETGNNVAGLSVDIVMDRADGSIADVASSTTVGQPPGMMRITAVWVPQPANTDPAWLARWVKPTAALANLPGPMASAEPEPEPEPEEQDDEPVSVKVPLEELINFITNAQTLAQAPVLAALDALHDDVAEIKRVQAQGLGGTVLTYKVRLKP